MSSFLDIYKMMNYELEFHFHSILYSMLLFVRILYYNNKNETWASPNGLYVRGSSVFCSQVCDTHIEKFCRIDIPSLCCSCHTQGAHPFVEVWKHRWKGSGFCDTGCRTQRTLFSLDPSHSPRKGGWKTFKRTLHFSWGFSHPLKLTLELFLGRVGGGVQEKPCG